MPRQTKTTTATVAPEQPEEQAQELTVRVPSNTQLEVARTAIKKLRQGLDSSNSHLQVSSLVAIFIWQLTLRPYLDEELNDIWVNMQDEFSIGVLVTAAKNYKVPISVKNGKAFLDYSGYADTELPPREY